jgi:malonyl CoA-acyl carrier protein transacylase
MTRTASEVTQPDRILRLAADDPAGLAALLAAPDADLIALADPFGGAVASDGPARLGIVAPNAKRLGLARKLVAGGRAWRGRNDIWFSPAPLLADGKGIAFLFPGLEGDFAPRIDDVAAWLGMPVPGVNDSSVGRHAASLVGIGKLLDAAMGALAIRPTALAGHSVGEWSAMFAGGMFGGTLAEELLERTNVDAILVPGVDFGVLGCGIDRVRAELPRWPDLVVSHENSTNQTVVCGPVESVAALVAEFRAKAVICQTLPFQSGFHTPMLRPHLAKFADDVRGLTFQGADIPVWSATTTRPFPTDPETIRELYVRHLLEPVRFRGLVEGLYASGVRVFVQVGAGQLGSLVDDTLREADHLTVAANSTHRSGLDQLRRLATAVWSEGGRPNFSALANPAPQKTAPANAFAASSPTGQTPTLPGGGPEASLSAQVRNASADREPVDNRAAWGQLAPIAADLPVLDVQPNSSAAAVGRLEMFGDRYPMAAELSALMGDVADMVTSVLAAANGAGAGSTQMVTPPVAPVLPPAGPAQAAVSALDIPVRVSTADMPYLTDHCFVVQRAGWPDEIDRRPVVPATTIVTHMMAAAEQAAPGRRAIGLDGVSLHRWLVAAPPQDIVIKVRPLTADSVKVTVGEHAEATVLLGDDRYVTPTEGQWPPQPDEHPTALTADQLYDQRWLFHGRRFRVMTKSVAIAPFAFRGEMTVTDAPGALLDGVGQMLGQWLAEIHPNRSIAFPIRMDRIRFHTPEPPPGTKVECAIRITHCTDDIVEMDGRITVAGKPFVTINGWRDHRFDSDQPAATVHRFPELGTLSKRQPDGWWLAIEVSSSLASRELYINKYLAAEERDEYNAHSPRGRRAWLLRRIVVKDAVRGWLWDKGAGPLFPAEIAVTEGPVAADGSTHCVATGRHGLAMSPLHVAVAHCGEIAAAIVSPQISTRGHVETGGGSTVVRVTEVSSDADVDRAMMSASDFLTSAGQDVRTELVRNPDGLPPRRYVVAWTTGMAQQKQKEGTR